MVTLRVMALKNVMMATRWIKTLAATIAGWLAAVMALFEMILRRAS
jgi:uncharacterized membrane protein